MPDVEHELESNVNSKAFDGYQFVAEDTTEDYTFWKTLTVDLEKKKVIIFIDYQYFNHTYYFII